MPYTNNIVYETSDLPDKPSDTIDQETYLLRLQGGQGGNPGEKGYKAQLLMSKTTIDDVENISLGTLNFYNFNRTEIGNESDAGYAFNIVETASAQSDLTIGFYNSLPSSYIYASSDNLKFNEMYSGVTISEDPIGNGGSFGDFTVLSDSTISASVDSSLGLNKHYLPFTDSSTILKRSLLINNASNPSSNRISSKFANLYVFYVAELDIADGLATFTTAEHDYNFSFDVVVSDASSFLAEDRIRLVHPLGYFSIEGNIESIAGNTLTLYQDSRQFNLPTKNRVIFPVGSTVTIVNRSLNHNFFSTVSEVSSASKSDYSPLFRNQVGTMGLSFDISKGLTTASKELYNTLNWIKDSSLTSPIEQNLGVKLDRIYTRAYSQDQYGVDSTRLLIKNKPKLSLFYHGIEKRDNSIFYTCGNETRTFAKRLLTSQESSTIDLLNGNANFLLIGSPISMTNGAERVYHSCKLYEVLVYHNLDFRLSFNPIDIIRASLINKYKERMFFSSVEPQPSDVYYSKTDRINILGKIKQS